MAEIDVITATIASGQSLSAEVDIGNKSLVGIVVPANWTTAGISLQASPDGGVTWAEVVDQTATAVGCSSLTGGTLAWFVNFTNIQLRGPVAFKIRSGSQASPVNQTNSVSLQLITRLVM
jgi:hypothetical protein